MLPPNQSDQVTRFDSRSLLKINMPEPSLEATETITPNAKFVVSQDIPPLADYSELPSGMRYLGYKLTVQVPSFMNMSTMSYGDIMDIQSNTSRTSSFDITNPTVSSPQYVFIVKDGVFNTTTLYENTLEINITGQIDKSKRDLYKGYIEGDYIKYPLKKETLQTLVDGTKTLYSSNEDVMSIYYPAATGTPVAKTVEKNVATKAYFTNQTFLQTTVTGLNGLSKNWTDNTIEVVYDANNKISIEDKLNAGLVAI